MQIPFHRDNVIVACLERVSIEGRKTKTKVITLANHKRRRQSVNQSKLEVITLSRNKALENMHKINTFQNSFFFFFVKVREGSIVVAFRVLPSTEGQDLSEFTGDITAKVWNII